MARHEAVETGLDVPAANGVERPREPVAEMEPDCCTVIAVGPRRPVGVDRDIVLEGLFEDRHGARFGARFRWIATTGDIAEHPVRHPARLLGRYPAVASEDDPLVGRLPAAAVGAVVDEIGFKAGRLHAHAEADELVVPGEP